MKNFFPLMIIALVALFSCNDASNQAEDNTDSGTPAVTDNSAAVSNIVTKQITLSSDQEVPANSSAATGTADISYNKDSKTLTYTVTYSGLTDKASMAHIHGTAAKGANAGVKHDLTGVLQKETSGSFTDSVKIDASGIAEDSLISGFYYFNIHTPKNPGGEIRGQIEF